MELNPTNIKDMGSTNPLFSMVKQIGIVYERYHDSSRNAGHASTRTKHSERPEANLASSGKVHL